MADNTRHAAWHTTYEVHEVVDDTAIDLGLRFRSDDFTEAIEWALEYLQPNDPSDREVSALQIVKDEAGKREVVWSYSLRQAQAGHQDMVRLWGFNPTQSWNLPPALKR